jgi:uncharacterized lipoprotein YajG
VKKIVLALICLLTGCSYVPESISVNYKPTLESQPVAGAENIHVEVQVVDNRRHGTKVSYKKGDGYVEMAAIRLDGSLSDAISTGVQEELKKLGFKIGPGHASVEIEIQKFFNDFKKGFFTDRGVSELIFGVHVKRPNGDITYSKTIMGIGERDGLWMHSGSNARKSLEEALTDAIHKLLQDPSFIQALTKKM